MSIKKILQCSSILVAIASIAIVASLITVDKSKQAMLEAQVQRDLSILLATELRESSRNLTAMVREFSVTGNERAASTYKDIVLIRAGKKTPR